MRRIAVSLLTIAVLAVAAFAQGTDTGTAATSTNKKAIFRPTKDQISQVQTKLKNANLYSGEATGRLDTASRDAIKSWQGSNGLKKTGTLNRATLEKMGIELTDRQKAIPVDPKSYASADEKTPLKSPASNGPKRPAPFRANKDQIMAAQKILRVGKMLEGGEEGRLDDTTRAGLGKYQEAHGLKVTKTLNAVTLQKMGIALTDKQKEQVAAQAAYNAAKNN